MFSLIEFTDSFRIIIQWVIKLRCSKLLLLKATSQIMQKALQCLPGPGAPICTVNTWYSAVGDLWVPVRVLAEAWQRCRHLLFWFLTEEQLLWRGWCVLPLCLNSWLLMIWLSNSLFNACIPRFVYPFILQWPFELFSSFGYCEYANIVNIWMLVYKYLCVHFCFHFLWIYTQR